IDALADAVGFDAIGSGTVDPDTLLPNRVWTRGLGCPVISLTDLRDVAPGRPSRPVAVLSDGVLSGMALARGSRPVVVLSDGKHPTAAPHVLARASCTVCALGCARPGIP